MFINVIHQKIARFFELNRIEFKYSADPEDECFIFRYNENIDWEMLSFNRINGIGLQGAIEDLTLRIALQRKYDAKMAIRGRHLNLLMNVSL